MESVSISLISTNYWVILIQKGYYDIKYNSRKPIELAVITFHTIMVYLEKDNGNSRNGSVLFVTTLRQDKIRRIQGFQLCP
jgi:hypothetical protein